VAGNAAILPEWGKWQDYWRFEPWLPYCRIYMAMTHKAQTHAEHAPHQPGCNGHEVTSTAPALEAAGSVANKSSNFELVLKPKGK
jgi:hypothetical protein